MIYRPYPSLPLTDALRQFRAEFADIKSIADLALLSRPSAAINSSINFSNWRFHEFFRLFTRPAIVPGFSFGELPMVSANKLADAILQDRERRKQKPTATRSRAPADSFDPFAFTRWRVVAGGDQGYLPKTHMRMGPVGWFIACGHCGAEFESKGWGYCPTCMKLSAEERRQEAWLKARDYAPSERSCQTPGCNDSIPKRARADARYCSQQCARKAQNARAYAPGYQGSAHPVFSTPTREISQQNQRAFSSLFEPTDFPKNLVSGDRRGRSLPPDLVETILKTEIERQRI